MNPSRVLILSTVDGRTNEIATRLGAEPVSSKDDMELHLWRIDNKYYASEQVLCTLRNPSDNISAEDVEAIIVHHDPQANNAEEKLNQWSSLISACDAADVLLYCCDTISDPAVRDKVLDWCSAQKFELVEINSCDTTEETDSENNTYGINRIIEALQSHMWVDMTLKGQGRSTSENLHPDIEQVGGNLENIHLSQDRLERIQMDCVLDGIMGGENSDFGELFRHIIAMKEHAASLPTDRRRLAAEQIATAFWNAIGGDEVELPDWMFL